MRINGFITGEQYWDALFRMIDHSVAWHVATFCCEGNNAYRLINRIRDHEIPIQILVGMPPERRMQRLQVKFVQSLPWPNWKLTNKCHIKAVAVRFDNGEYSAIVGGSNWTDSTWEDLNFYIESDAKPIWDAIEDAWRKMPYYTTPIRKHKG